MARHLFLLSILLSVSWLAVCHAAEASETDKKPEEPSVQAVKPEKSKALTNALEKIRGSAPQQFPLPYPIPFGFIPAGNMKTNANKNYDGDNDGDGYDDDDDGYDGSDDGYPGTCSSSGNNVNQIINLLSPPLLQPLWPVLLELLKPQICGCNPGVNCPGTDYPGTDYPGTDYPGTEYGGDDDDDGYDGDDDNYDGGDSYDGDDDGGYDDYGNKKKKTQAPNKKNSQKNPSSHKKNGSKKNPKKPESTKASNNKRKPSSKKPSGKTKSILSGFEGVGPAPSSYPLLALLLHQQQEQARLQNELRVAKQKAHSQSSRK